jgi:outer membrane beta-barrel protein
MKIASCPLAFALWLAAGPALAQQAPAAATATPEEGARGQIEQDIEKFWGPRRKVTVVQKRRHPKRGRYEISVHFGTIPNDAFVNYLPVGVRAAYHFREWVGLEFGFLYMPSFNSSLADGFANIGQGTALEAFTKDLTLYDKQKMLFHLSATFSLLYGKVALMQTKLSHFDVFLTVGPSFHLMDGVGAGGAPGGTAFKVGGTAGAGLKFFINDFFGVRLDVRQYVFPKSSEAGGGLHKPTEISLGATFFAG